MQFWKSFGQYIDASVSDTLFNWYIFVMFYRISCLWPKALPTAIFLNHSVTLSLIACSAMRLSANGEFGDYITFIYKFQKSQLQLSFMTHNCRPIIHTCCFFNTIKKLLKFLKNIDLFLLFKILFRFPFEVV